MQTFLPYPNFYASARALDPSRRRNQRNESLIIARTLTGWYAQRGGKGWPHHPATRMWAGHERHLFRYSIAFCQVCRDNGEEGDIEHHIRELRRFFRRRYEKPPWLGDEHFHRTHRSNLLRKDPAFYGPLFPDDPADLDYFWPA